MFQRDEGRKRSFRKGKKSIEVWDLSGFEIDLDDILSGLKYEDGHYDLVSLSDKDYQKNWMSRLPAGINRKMKFRRSDPEKTERRIW